MIRLGAMMNADDLENTTLSADCHAEQPWIAAPHPE